MHPSLEPLLYDMYQKEQRKCNVVIAALSYVKCVDDIDPRCKILLCYSIYYLAGSGISLIAKTPSKLSLTVDGATLMS